MNGFKVCLYGVAVLSCLACTILLFRAYLQKRVRLLLWSSLCFVGLTANNLSLFLDLVVFPSVDLRLLRLGTALAGMLCLLYAFIWESD